MPEDLDRLRRETERLETLLDSGLRDRLLAIPGVHHVSTGLKQVGGRVTHELAILVYVREKRAAADVPPAEFISPQIETVPTDVNVVPQIDFSDDDAKYRPLVGGIQITNGIKQLNAAMTGVVMDSGTLGCLATRISDGKPVLLTNWHVLSRYGGKVSDHVFQPRPVAELDDITDTFPKRPSSTDNAIGKIAKMQVDTEVDCAIATINTCYSLCCNCGVTFNNEIKGLNINGADTIAGRALATNGQTVFKVGKKTGRREGIVVTTNYPQFSITRDGQTFTFKGQIQIGNVGGKAFAESGDSGSAVISSDGKIVGLYFAGPTPNDFGLANHIALVESALGIQVNIASGGSGGFSSGATESALRQDDLLDVLVVRLSRSEAGRALLDRVERHADEGIALVNHQRSVTVAWHRHRGPEWLAHVVRSARVPAYHLPRAIEGVTLRNLLLAMGEALRGHGSAALSEDIGRILPQIEAWPDHVRDSDALFRLVEEPHRPLSVRLS